MIVVTGASGNLGRKIVEKLITQIPASQVAVSVRNTEKVSDLQEHGVRVRKGDFNDPESLKYSFEGATQVLIVSVNLVEEENLLQMHGNAFRAAKAAGAKRILYTSHQAASSGSAFLPAQAHAATEELLKTIGVAYTSLRNGFYAEAILGITGSTINDDKIITPQDGRVSWTAIPDLAEAAVYALLHGDELNGVTPPLVNPQNLNFDDIAKIASDLSGRKIERLIVSDGEYHQQLISNGIPLGTADMIISMFVAGRNGEFEAVDDTLPKLLAIDPITVEDILKTYIEKQHQ